MFNVTIYYKDGRRSIYDHVAQITNISDNMVIDFITDFDDHIEKVFEAKSIESMRVNIYES